MKEHAVPQNIMSVEFKLFGSWLSLREFIFIGVSLAAAYLFFLLMKSGAIPPLLAWPVMILFGLGGPIIALVPFQERRLDQWLISFLLAIKNPTKRVWKKNGYEPITTKSDRLISRKDQVVNSPLANLTKKETQQAQDPNLNEASNQIDQNEQARLNQISNTMNMLSNNNPPQQNNPEPSNSNTPTSNVGQSNSAPINPQAQPKNPTDPSQYNNPTNQTQKTITEQAPSIANSNTNQQGSQNPLPNGIPQNQPTNINQTPVVANQTTPTAQPNPTISQIQNNQVQTPNLVQSTTQTPVQKTVQRTQPHTQQINDQNNVQPSQISQQQASNPMNQNSQSNIPISQKLEFQGSQTNPTPEEPKVQVINLTDEIINKIKTEIPGLTERPNIINLVVKDREGKGLTGVVSITKEAIDNGKAVRAGISNPLGQIINNIPLKNGQYRISLTKQGYKLPELEVSLNGRMLPAIEIKAL